MLGGSPETLIIKWCLGGAFVIVTCLFAGKIIFLFYAFANLKVHGFLAWLNSPDAMKAIGDFMWNCMKAGGHGLWTAITK